MASTQDVPPRGGSTMTTVPAHAPSPSTPTTANALPGGEGERGRGRAMLVGAIMATVVISAGLMVGFIWYRWSGVREPTTAVIIMGDASLDGTVITVTGQGGPEHTALNAVNNYRAAVLVEPGRYWVKAERNGVMLLRREVEVERFLAVQFDLTRLAEQQPPPDPARSGGAEAEAPANP